MAKKKVTVAKGVKVKYGTDNRIRKKLSSSNTAKYKKVSPKDFTGKVGSAIAYNFTINAVKEI